MLRALRTGALGMLAQQRGVDNIANNLANANTTGFKRATIVFNDLLYQTVSAPGEGETSQVQQNRPPYKWDTAQPPLQRLEISLQGSFTETSNPLDLAINGEGFLPGCQDQTAPLLTRATARLTLSSEGTIVTQGGLPLEPEISVPPDASRITIGQDGTVEAYIAGEAIPVVLGQIELARFNNTAGLQAIGGNLYMESSASGEPILSTAGENGLGVIRQGFLESSNVAVVQEMVNLITAQRAYEVNSKVVTTSDQMLSQANQIKR